MRKHYSIPLDWQPIGLQTLINLIEIGWGKNKKTENNKVNIYIIKYERKRLNINIVFLTAEFIIFFFVIWSDIASQRPPNFGDKRLHWNKGRQKPECLQVMQVSAIFHEESVLTLKAGNFWKWISLSKPWNHLLSEDISSTK